MQLTQTDRIRLDMTRAALAGFPTGGTAEAVAMCLDRRRPVSDVAEDLATLTRLGEARELDDGLFAPPSAGLERWAPRPGDRVVLSSGQGRPLNVWRVERAASMDATHRFALVITRDDGHPAAGNGG